MTLDQIKLVAGLVGALVLFAAGAGAAWRISSTDCEAKILRIKAQHDSDKQVAADVTMATMRATENHITKLEIDHASDLENIRVLHNSVVRVRVPTCSAVQPSVGEPAQTGGISVPTTTTDRPPEPAQTAFDVARSGMESDAEEWGRAIANCKVIQEYVKKIP